MIIASTKVRTRVGGIGGAVAEITDVNGLPEALASTLTTDDFEIQEATTNATGDINITFNNTYVSPPNVFISPINITVFDKVTITNITNTNVTIKGKKNSLIDVAGSSVLSAVFDNLVGCVVKVLIIK